MRRERLPHVGGALAHDRELALTLVAACGQYWSSTAQLAEGRAYVDAALFPDAPPPLRAQHDQDALWQGLAGNDLQVISTDHCPFCMKGQKELGANDFSLIPNGAPGVETRLSMVYDGGVRSGKIGLNRFVELVSTAPARMMGLYPRKGTIAVGSDADLVIFDPSRTETISAATHHSRIDYSLYEGLEVTGVPTTVLVRGEPVLVDRQFVGKPGSGQFLKRSLYQRQ